MALRKRFRVYKEAEVSHGGLGDAAGSGFEFALSSVADGNDVYLASETITADARVSAGLGDSDQRSLYTTFRSGLIDRLQIGWFIGQAVADVQTRPVGIEKIVGIEQGDRTVRIWTEEVQDGTP